MAPSLLGMASVLMALISIAVGTCAATETTEWPSLRFHFTLKRSSMKAYGQSEFDMYANPIVPDNQDKVLYDVFATFTEGNALSNYTLIDGVAHSSSTPYSGGPSDNSRATSTVSCLDSEAGKLPAINAIVAAINGATAASGSSSNAIECSNGSLFKVTVNGIDFALCASGPSGFTMQGTDMDITVEFLESAIDIQTPNTTGKGDCMKVASVSSVTSISKSVLTGQPLSRHERSLKAAFEFSFRDESTCTCKSTPRPCIFIHGLGVKQEVAGNQDWFSYWGESIKGHTPCCSSVKFAHLNTVNNTWTSKTQQRKVSERALAVSNSSTKTAIKDTIFVTHSMGNLMFTGALATGKCSLDSSSTWVGMAGPLVGSMASDFAQESCAGETNVVWEDIGDITGRCPPNTGLKSLAYQHGSYSSKRLDAAYAAAQKVYREQTYALMCGRAYSGLTSKYQAKFWLLGHTIPHKSKKNDGMVEFQSCAPGISASKFSTNYRDRFYVTRLNHYDMQFLAGDAMLDEAKMPVKWFECLL
ncbi:hypothetical protein PF008_g19022 [Phytophthora fragariae]|uniref:Uncharacterized protein n=1 Tax=Phytophthora fragariae TaxID=53985 RepID=A0A6G0R3W2_9STRA|nr:hypothetical protein PF008_g19022 [Phytophthora fragariae]